MAADLQKDFFVECLVVVAEGELLLDLAALPVLLLLHLPLPVLVGSASVVLVSYGSRVPLGLLPEVGQLVPLAQYLIRLFEFDPGELEEFRLMDFFACRSSFQSRRCHH